MRKRKKGRKPLKKGYQQITKQEYLGLTDPTIFDLVVIVSGGVVQGVASKNPDLKVSVLDFDDMKADELDREDRQEVEDKASENFPHAVF